MILRNEYAVAMNDYLIEVELDENYNVISAIALEDINDKINVKKGDTIPDCEWFDYALFGEIAKDEYEVKNDELEFCE